MEDTRNAADGSRTSGGGMSGGASGSNPAVAKSPPSSAPASKKPAARGGWIRAAGKDRIAWIPIGFGIALLLAALGYTWSSIQAYLFGRNIRKVEEYWRRNRPESEKPLPLRDLLHARIEVGPEGEGGPVTLVYDFPRESNPRGDEPADTIPQLRDWECKVEKGTFLPVVPLLSNISFEGDIDVSFDLVPWRGTDIMAKVCWFDAEKTGVVFALMRDGRCLFYLLRQGYDYPIGEERRIAPPERGRAIALRVALAGRSVEAFVDGAKVCEGRVPAEWPQDRRYDHGASQGRLAADLKRPPLAGFVGLDTGDKVGAKVTGITIFGRVSPAWAEEKSRCVRARRAVEEYSRRESGSGGKHSITERVEPDGSAQRNEEAPQKDVGGKTEEPAGK
ncbi:MAG: hypothetical protein N3A38_02260 [Planctomycetota bacterium]|nr:hypothetical protein [Planctomycetota bacterium]